MNTYEPIIGLEVHVELNTASKMFCRDSTRYFGETPNTHVCPICLGLPGSLPYANKTAVEACIKIGLALGCKVSEKAVFERKNYFYPDLAKGFQISQYRWPLCRSGKLEVRSENGENREVRINRVHLEEDTAKLLHQLEMSNGGKTLIDFNRAGVPLVEIVTEPDFTDTAEIKDYAKKLQQLMRYLGASNADMEKGDMRLEANISVRSLGSHLKGGSVKLPDYRVELKNINSFRFMVAAVEYEIKRQTEALERGEKPANETRGWDEIRKQTFTQRVKETADDYRYFPEPDLPVVVKDSVRVRGIEESMTELPWEKANRFVKEYSLSTSQANILTETQEFANYFEEVVRIVQEHSISLSTSKIANTLINKKFDREKILPARFVEMLREDVEKPTLPRERLESTIEEVIKENKGAVEDYRRGRENALQFLVGQVMAKTRGQVNPTATRDLLKKKLGTSDDS